MERVRFMASSRGLGLIVLCCFFVSSSAFGEVGVTDKEILVGTVNVTSGPAADLGKDLNLGAKAYFDKINKAGGVNGRKITVFHEDDGYEPNQTMAAGKSLVEGKKIFSFFNSVGTPTTKILIMLLDKENVPLVGAFSGARILRDPVNPNVFNVRASYMDEGEMIVDGLVKSGIKDIGAFIQDDAYGEAGLTAAVRALEKRELRPKGIGRFQRNTEIVDHALDELIKAAPKAVLMVGTYKSTTAFVRNAKKRVFTPKFFNLSFVGTYAFIKEAGKDAEGTYISQVMPNPDDSSLPIVKQFREDMKAIGENSLKFGALEGYLNAVVFVEGLKAAGKDLNRVSFRKALEGLDIDLGGYRVKFSAKNHQGNSDVHLTKVEGGKAVTVNKVD